MNETLAGLSFGASVSRVFSKYATFGGRATRSEYWWFYLFTVLVSIALSILQGVAGQDNGFAGFISIVSLLISLALFIPVLAVTVRRLHDTNRSGWWVLIGLIPLLGAIILLVFVLLRSDEVDNRFGPAPTVVA